MAEKEYLYTEDEVRKMWEREPEEQYQIALAKCLEAIARMDGEVAVSFSGGKDSAVLLYIMACAWTLSSHKAEPLRVFFADTSNEFISARKYRSDYIKWIEDKFEIRIEYHEARADDNYFNVVDTVGLPFISKKVSRMIRDAKEMFKKLGLKYADIESHMPQHYTAKHIESMIEAADYMRGLGFSDTVILNLTKIRSDNKIGRRFLPVQYRPIIDNDNIELSEKCCDILKKEPLKKTEREIGNLLPVTGEMAMDSRDRMTAYRMTGCNLFDSDRPKSKPLGPMTEQAILQFIYTRKVPIMQPYGECKCNGCGEYKLTGEQRTGCKLCGFGIVYDPERFLRLNGFEPKIVKFAFTSKENGGLGYREICQFLNEHCGMKIAIPEVEDGYYKRRSLDYQEKRRKETEVKQSDRKESGSRVDVGQSV